MNLIEALKSGRPFRRLSKNCIPRNDPKPGCPNYIEGWFTATSIPYLILLVEDILADDWEVKEVTVNITVQKFWEAYAEAVKAEGLPYLSSPGYPLYFHESVSRVINKLVRNLGLE